jgi:hypothetical protein
MPIFVQEICKFMLNCRGKTTLDASYPRHNLIKGLFPGQTDWTGTDRVAMLIRVGLCGGRFSQMR